LIQILFALFSISIPLLDPLRHHIRILVSLLSEFLVHLLY
jgi:hypothetical protein